MRKTWKMKNQKIEIDFDKVSWVSEKESSYEITLNGGSWSQQKRFYNEDVQTITEAKNIIKNNFIKDLKAAVAMKNANLDFDGNEYLQKLIDAIK